MKHLIVFPFYCREEIERHLKTADFLNHFSVWDVPVEFLLAAKRPGLDFSGLKAAWSRLGSVHVLENDIRTEGHPRGPAALFWKTMDDVKRSFAPDKGFVLWMESDMIPVKKDWLSRLDSEWRSLPDLLVMGLFRPACYVGDYFVRDHINGGACYAKDVIDFIPEDERVCPFDCALFPFVERTGHYKKSKLFSFATASALDRDLANPEAAILHGYLQPKDRFLDECMARLRGKPRGPSVFSRFMRWMGRKDCCRYRRRHKGKSNCPVHGA